MTARPDCSIGRKQAKVGSDIDRALVVTNEPVPPQKQVAFVEELRRQGFSAFTVDEAGNDVERGNRKVEFFTANELLGEYRAKGIGAQRVQTFLAGKEVE